MGRKFIDLVGQRFGRLVVISKSENDKRGNARWLCKCSCGNTKVVQGYNLTGGKTKSCGCIVKEKMTTHGKCSTREYEIWEAIIQRCTNDKCPAYKDYGLRGISVCEEWLSFDGFWKDMAEGYSDLLTIDRVDVNGDYCKENCRWADSSTQGHNRRKRKNCSSFYIGVHFDSDREMWVSQILKNSKYVFLGRYLDEAEAALAYDNASELYYGDRPNKTTREE